MKKVFQYLPLHFVIFLSLGILTEFYSSIWQLGFLKLIVLLSILGLSIVIIPNKFTRTFLTFLFFFFTGVSSVHFNNDLNYKNYYKTVSKVNSSTILKVDKVLKSGNYYDKYEVEVVQIDNTKTIGKVLLNVSKESKDINFKVDEFIFTKSSFTALNPALNPHQFDYKYYLEKKGIYQQLYLQEDEYQRLGMHAFSLVGLSASFRNKIQESLSHFDFEADELSVINALLLGQRQDISKDLISDYSNAGAIHILAVSGLHVGIILLILSFLFKPLERFRNGKLIKSLLIICILWMFAFIAGLSASVIRAVTMFTFLAIGNAFQSKKVTEFSLITSMFFLLLFKPLFLFDVGFQLSYLAVFGIIWVQPKLYGIWKPKVKLLDYFWQLVTVSIAAQVGILPLSIYYFHQFPGLFILSNLVIIPFLGFILISGIIVIFAGLIGVLPQFLASAYGIIISLMNDFVRWISQQESFLFSSISLSFLKMISLYCILFFGIYFLMNMKSKKLIYFLCALLFVQSVYVFENHQKKDKKEFIVFHKSRKSVLGIRNGNRLNIFHNLDSVEMTGSKIIQTYSIGENIHPEFYKEPVSVINFKNKNVLVVDSLGVYKVNGLNNPIVLLQNSPKINLERLIKTTMPSQIIADGSNYKSYIRSWEIICLKLKFPFHYTGEKGAFIY